MPCALTLGPLRTLHPPVTGAGRCHITAVDRSRSATCRDTSRPQLQELGPVLLPKVQAGVRVKWITSSSDSSVVA